MAKETLFRTCMFGGYNKQDVQEYIKRLEDELVKAKKENEGVGNRDFVQKREVKEEESDIMILSEILGDEKDGPQESFFKPVESIEQETAPEEKQLDKADERLREADGCLDEMKEQYEKVQKQLEALKKENQDLQSEVDLLKKEKEDYEEDYRAVKNVLLNARVDAEIILAKAQEKAKLIAAESQKQIEDKRREAIMIFSRCLEDNQHRLTMSKGYLEEQVKNIERVQHEISILEEGLKESQDENQQA